MNRSEVYPHKKMCNKVVATNRENMLRQSDGSENYRAVAYAEVGHEAVGIFPFRNKIHLLVYLF